MTLNAGPSSPEWKISSASGGTNCVEVAFSAGQVLVRDSKNREVGHLSFTGPSWQDFVATISRTPGR
jgi:hypothetical protein